MGCVGDVSDAGPNHKRVIVKNKSNGISARGADNSCSNLYTTLSALRASIPLSLFFTPLQGIAR